MNYLAHFQLAAGCDDLIVGGLLGDFIKGPLKGQYPLQLERGIALHRRIDAYTDSHPLLKDCQRLMPAEFHRYAGIMLDVLFDHYLNRNWQQFHDQPLVDFSNDVYQLLSAAELPANARIQADKLIEHSVLENYCHWQTVAATLEMISRRIRRDNPLARSAPVLELHFDELERRFLQFYPEVQQYVAEVRGQWS